MVTLTDFVVCKGFPDLYITGVRNKEPTMSKLTASLVAVAESQAKAFESYKDRDALKKAIARLANSPRIAKPFKDALTRLNASVTEQLIEAVAKSFAHTLREWLSEDEMELVLSPDSSVDEHDLCDANEAMIEALADNGIEFKADCPVCDAVCDPAWDLARDHAFQPW